MPIIPTNLGGGEDYRKLPLSMNTQKTPHAPSTASPPEIALGRIETLCSDQVFEGGSQPEESQPTAPTSSGFGEVIRQGFNYLKWSGSAFVSSIAILVGSKMLVEPVIESVAIIVSGGASFAWHASMFSFLAMTALFGFLAARERISQKRLCITIGLGLLLAVYGSIWILLQPKSDWLYGATIIAAQLLTYAAAVYCGMKMPEREKVESQKGFLMKCVSNIGMVLSIFAAVIAFKLGSAQLSSMAQGTLHNGKAAPTTEYVDFENSPFAFEDYQGKVVLVEFWAPWCAPCVAAMPHLRSLQEQYGEREDFAMVSIAVSASRESSKEVFEEQGCDWKLLFKPDTDVSDTKKDNPLAENQSPEFRPKGVPSAYIINRDGKVIAAGIRGSDIDTKLQELLGGESH